MRITGFAIIAVMAISCVNLAQDVAPDAEKVDSGELLKRYIEAEGEEKDGLRKELLALSTHELRAAIAAYPFEAPAKSGLAEFEIVCPDGYQRPYWIYVPEGYDPAEPCPLLVCLHGGVSGWPLRGARGSPPAGQSAINYWVPHLTEEWADKVLIMGCSAGPRETHEKAVWWETAGQLNVLAMVADAKRKFNIDDARVVINGHSDGGSGSFAFAYRMPDAWAGMFSMNGNPLVPTADGSPVWLENLRGQNIYCFNGGRDGLYPAARMTPIYEQANKAGADIEFVTHPELDHQVGAVLKDEVRKFLRGPLTEWRRDLLPSRVDWTTVDGARGSRAWLGIDQVVDLGDHNRAPANAEIKIPGRRVQLGVRMQRDVEQPTVESVVKGTTAEEMGIEEGDVIKKLDEDEIASLQDLIDALGKKSPGDKVTIVVERDGEDVELEGSFDTAQREESEDAPLEARVIAELGEPGEIELTVRNAGQVTIRVAPSMLDAGGNLRVRVNRADDGEIALVLKQKFEADNAYILDAFEKTGDRKLPWIGEWTLDIKKILGVKVKPAKPDAPEDEF